MRRFLWSLCVALSATNAMAETAPSTAAPTPTFITVGIDALKEFLHGKPATAKKALPPKRRAVIVWEASTPKDTGIDGFLNAFADALMARDATALEPLISKQYRVEGLPKEVEPRSVLRQAIEQLPGPAQILVQSVSTAGTEKIALTDILDARGETKQRRFRFDAFGKLISTDLFSIRVDDHHAGAK